MNEFQRFHSLICPTCMIDDITKCLASLCTNIEDSYMHTLVTKIFSVKTFGKKIFGQIFKYLAQIF